MMFSYLQNKRPNNRRSAVPSPTAAHRTAPSRNYHESPPYSTDIPDDSVPWSYHSEGISTAPSPVSPDPPKLPPIPRVASHHELRDLVEEHGLRINEFSSSSGQTFDKRAGSSHLMSTSALVDGVAVRTARKDGFHKVTSPRFERRSVLSMPSEDRSQDDRSRSNNLTLGRINTNLESFHNPLRPKSAGNYISTPPPQRPPPPPPTISLQTVRPGVSQARLAKTKLNILNPMSLLARRRASHAVTENGSEKGVHAKSLSIPGVNLPDDYDPRIRGKVVHDFSVPRSARSFSSNDLNISPADLKKAHDSHGTNQYRLSPNPQSALLEEDHSPHGMEREHTPIFKEHFEDDIGLEGARHETSVKQRMSAFMYQVSLKESYPDPDPGFNSLPPFARNLPNRLSKAAESGCPASSNQPLEVVLETTLVKSPSTENSVKASPPLSPPKARSRASSKADSVFQPTGLPMRLKSNASRFSFDLAGVGSSAQEKLLEERHRQKANQKVRESSVSGTSDMRHYQNEAHEEYSDAEYDDMDSDDGLEEKIPGVNADTGDRLFPIAAQALQDSQQSSPIKSAFTNPVSVSTGVTSLNQEQLTTSPSSTASKENELMPRALKTPHVNLDCGSHGHPVRTKMESHVPLAGLPPRPMDDEDDLYFDDGIIEDLERNDDQVFDESLLDDDTSRIYGLPLRDLKSRPENQGISKLEINVLPSDLARIESKNPFVKYNHEAHPGFSQTAGLTKDNLAAYHDALAFATNQAALNGEFNRRQNIGPSGQDDLSNEIDSAPGMTPDVDRTSREIDGLSYGQGIEDPEDFDFDDTLSDDPIIAAANAEALENDDDGFYGQEFGFFARATGSAEYANGGYFGPPGTVGLGRSHSGRADFQEPSLTPITERSEWSNRNSTISLAVHGYQQSLQPTLSSPGLAHLTDMLPREEDNISLSALMRLRRSAWGDSNTSLHSSSGSQISGSPLNNVHAFPTSPIAASSKTPAASSTFSLGGSSGLNSSDSSDTSPSSPTITLTTQMIPSAATATMAPPPQTEDFSLARQRSPPQLRPKGHSRTNSGRA